MKLTQLISKAQSILQSQGDIECHLQSNPKHADQSTEIVASDEFFLVPEEYKPEDGGVICNIRDWPY